MFKFSCHVWLVFIATFLTSATYWMIWPFLAVILNQSYKMSPSQIGFALGVAVLVSTLVGIYFGNLSDRVGRNKVILLGGGLAIIGYILLAYAAHVNEFIFAIILIALSRGLIDPLGKAVFGDILESTKDRVRALQIRNFIVNLGAGVGSIVGAYTGIAMQQMTFLLTASSFLIYIICMYKVLSKHDVITRSHTQETSKSVRSFLKDLSVILSDSAFLGFVVVNILIWIIFTQFESSIPLYFSMQHINNISKFIGLIIFSNTLAVVLFQIPLIKLTQNMSTSSKIYVGLFILSISQLMFAFSSLQSHWAWIMSTLVFSIAEILLTTNLNIKIDEMAPKNLRGSYFSVSFLYRIGFGSYFGGLILQRIGGIGLFGFMFILSFFIIALYAYSSKLKRYTVTHISF